MTSGSGARRAGKPIGRRAPPSPCGYQSSCAQRRRFARHFWKRISLGTSRLMAAALPHRRPSFQNKPPSPPSSSRRTRRSCHNGSSRLRAFLSRGPMNCCAPTRLWHGHRDEENVEPGPVVGPVRGEARVRQRMPRRPLPPPPCSRIRACYVCGTFTTIRLSACTSSNTACEAQHVVYSLWLVACCRTLLCPGTPQCCAFSPDRSHVAVAGTAEGSVVMWDFREPNNMHRTKGQWFLRSGACA